MGSNLWNSLLARQFCFKRILSTTTKCTIVHFSTSKWNCNEEQNIVKSFIPPVTIPEIPLSNFVWDESTKNHPDKVALIDAVTGQSFTYSEAYDASKRFGSALRKEGLQKGDVLAIMMPNRPSYMMCLTGGTGVGVIVTTINPNYTAGEVARQLKMSKTKIVLTMQSYLPTMKEAIGRLENGHTIRIIVEDAKCDGMLSCTEMMMDNGSAYPKSIPDDFNFREDVALLPYSSGTTGLPKGVMLTHGNLVANMTQCIQPKELDFIRPATETFQPVIVCVMPMFHAFGMNVTSLPTLRVGGKVVTLPAFEPKVFLNAMETFKPTFMHFAPPLVSFCANSPDVKPHHLDSVNYVLVGAAPVGEVLINQFKKKAANVKFREGWGMTEAGPVGTMTPGNSIVAGSCGILLPNIDGKIVDLDSGAALGPGERGELCIRGPNIMKGYLDHTEATAHAIKDGWLHTGDIAFYDTSNKFFIVDRLKELIKVKAYQVPPAELEDLLRSHVDVLDVAVIGVPHDTMGEVPRAYIVKQNQHLNEKTIHDYTNKEVAEYKRLRGGVVFVDAIPKSPSGKILRRELKEAYIKS